MLVLFHIILEIPLLSFTHSARAHRMCPFRMTQSAPCALFLNAPLPLFQAAGNPNVVSILIRIALLSTSNEYSQHMFL